jgi:hypothetical protein
MPIVVTGAMIAPTLAMNRASRLRSILILRFVGTSIKACRNRQPDSVFWEFFYGSNAFTSTAIAIAR